MYNCYCKNCNNLIGTWNNKYKYYITNDYCNGIQSKNIDSIYFLDCNNCNKFVGILCDDVCENCFGEDEIIGEENLFNWFQKHKKIINYNNFCGICNTNNFRFQFWVFEELTFINNNIK